MAGDMKSFFSIASFDDSLESLCVFILKGQAIVKYKSAGNEFLSSTKLHWTMRKNLY
jgi:hypothetical protein